MTPLLKDLPGRQVETGSLANALALRGVKAPHTGLPYSEALLLGISGGIAVGYFIFEYTGHLPHLALLTRNTFDPLETLLDRLALPREVQQTVNPAQGQANLIAALESGHAPLVWADMFSLPYNHLPSGDDLYAMFPVTVVGQDGDRFLIADRSRRPFSLTAAELAQARGRVKKDRFRLMTVEPPDPARLPQAVQKGLWQCINLYTEAPPKGSRNNFGLAALAHWSKMLTNTRHKQSWARLFPAGPKLYQALAGSVHQPGLYSWIMTYHTTGPDADRATYADFLDEAAGLLERPALSAAAEHFRRSAQAWHALALAALPAEVPLLRQARELLDRRHKLRVEQGPAADDEVVKLHARLAELEAQAAESFPLSNGQVTDLLAGLARHVDEIAVIEKEAVAAMTAALA
jgi:hypothetical protein